MADRNDDKDTLSPEDRRGLMFASHLCHLIVQQVQPRLEGGEQDLDLIEKFAETAQAEIEKALSPRKA